MTKIGNTDGSVFFMVLQQYLMTPVLGDKLVMSAPHPDAPGTSAVTLSVVSGDGNVEIPPNVIAVLRALSRTTSAVGFGKIVTIENLPVVEGEEAKFTITIKGSRLTEGIK